MTDATARMPGKGTGRLAADRRLRRRYAADRRLRVMGAGAILLVLGALVFLVGDMLWEGRVAFRQHWMTIEVRLDPAVIDPDGAADRSGLLRADYAGLVKRALRERFPEVTERRERRQLAALASTGGANELRDLVMADPSIIGTTREISFPVSDDADIFLKGLVDRQVPEAERRISDNQIRWLDALVADGAIEPRYNFAFLTTGDSREPELAGIRGAIVGSFLTLLVTLALAFPLGVMTAVYLEEFAPKNRWTDFVEVNINNLAAVPSVVFGLLGLAVLLNVFGLPRSAPVVGGVVLALMTLPMIIISGRAALQSVPPSLAEAALGIGASRVQTVLHHVLPQAMPGMLTGTIIGMAQALGETAPLLMIGMVAFIVDVPGGFTDPATVLPVQIYLWADSPERAFVGKTAAATLVLLAFLIVMNGLAVWLRRKFGKR